MMAGTGGFCPTHRRSYLGAKCPDCALSAEDYYEGRIASLRAGIRMVMDVMRPGGILPDHAKIDVALESAQALLDSDLDKALSRSGDTETET